MALRRKLLIANALLLVTLLAMAGLCLLGLRRQQEHLQASFREYSALQLVESAAVRLISAKPKLRDPAAVQAVVLPELRVALDDIRHYKALLGMYDRLLPAEIGADEQARAKSLTKSASSEMAELVALLESPNFDPTDAGARADALAEELADLLKVCNTFLNETRLASDRDLRLAMIPVASLALLLPVASLLYGLWQYRRIMMPLQQLRDRSQRLAVGDFSSPCQLSGPREFAELSRDFNQMAEELHGFYRQLEEMVASKSRELVRSERLASVGFLAAGVAHEVNTPLHVISGYAELCAKRLRRQPASEQTAELLGWQDMIRDEAIRCRQITDKLLSLCRGSGGGGADRETVSLTRLASDVALMVRGLPSFQGRQLNVAIHPVDLFNVRGNPAELKQVLLNLAINALEAVAPKTGEVVIGARRTGETIELCVTDNGRGMDPATLQHVFEPFFTSKRGGGTAGTGLGLSITHAIVRDHGGRITAHSAGPGRGSRFTVTLPAELETPQDASGVAASRPTHETQESAA